MSTPFALAVVGPTASGKTHFAIQLAKTLGGEVISADSRQIYKYLDIGTAKPTMAERQGVPHHFLDILDPDIPYTAARFGREARLCALEIAARGLLPIVVGGSGLYVRAFTDGLFEGPGEDPEYRTQLEQLLKEKGEKALYEELKKVDPVSVERMEPGKPRRAIRALEVFQTTGKPISQHHADQVRQEEIRVVQVGLHVEREELYKRINERTASMVAKGLIKEVEGLRSMGFNRPLNGLNTVGYKEVFSLLDGECDMETMLERIRKNTRRFAKRQFTWFRGDDRIHWVEAGKGRSKEEIVQEVIAYSRSKEKFH